jgi:Ca-activated chloride channel family protein
VSAKLPEEKLMMRLNKFAIALTVLAGLLIYAAGPSEKAAPTQAGATSEGMTLVPVSVVDSKNQPIPSLKAEHFQLLEENKEQKVTYFSAAGEPINVGVVIALSAQGPVKTVGQQDRVTVDILNAASRVREANSPGMPALLDQLPLDSDGIFNLVTRSVENLAKQPSPRKALVIVSDGLISSGTQPANFGVPKSLLETARQVSFPIYFLYVVSSRPEPTLTESTKTGAGYYLQQMADASGGEMMVGEIENSLTKTSTELRDNLKNLYFLGFKSTNTAKDGKWRKLTVKLTPPAGVAKAKVNAKSRYFVAKAD